MHAATILTALSLLLAQNPETSARALVKRKRETRRAKRAKRTRTASANTVLIYEGPSMLDGRPIVAFATGLKGSANSKTGGMVQTYIMRADVSPSQAVHTGDDASVCGSCRHRGVLKTQKDGTTRNKDRSCYVSVFHAPRSIWEAWERGNVPSVGASELSELLRGRQLRHGAYGDPAAMPHALIAQMSAAADEVTGYTHQWKAGFALSEWLMASCDTPAEVREAREMGYRSFLVDSSPEGIKLERGHMRCPASEEMGKRLQCSDCMACGGDSSRHKAPAVVIRAHGSVARVKAAQARHRLPVLS